MDSLNNLFNQQPVCINLGLESFVEALHDQDIHCAHVNWKPPAGGDTRLIEILNWIED